MGEKIYANENATDGLRNQTASYSSSLLTAEKGRVAAAHAEKSPPTD